MLMFVLLLGWPPPPRRTPRTPSSRATPGRCSSARWASRSAPAAGERRTGATGLTARTAITTRRSDGRRNEGGCRPLFRRRSTSTTTARSIPTSIARLRRCPRSGSPGQPATMLRHQRRRRRGASDQAAVDPDPDSGGVDIPERRCRMDRRERAASGCSTCPNRSPPRTPTSTAASLARNSAAAASDRFDAPRHQPQRPR